jgi:hypothetical protein
VGLKEAHQGEPVMHDKGTHHQKHAEHRTQARHAETQEKDSFTEEPIAANVITTPIKGNFQGINKVERNFRTRTVAKHRVVSEIQETNPVTDTNLSINPPAHEGRSRPHNKGTDKATHQRTNHKWDNGHRVFPAKPIKLIREIRQEAIQAPMPLEFIFNLTEEAAEKNFFILKKYNFNLEKATTAQKSSPLGYGSEFRPPQTLKKIFKYQPLWA